MAYLVLSFLGGFQVIRNDRPVTEFKSNKVRALLAYLAVEAGRPHRREALAGLLWPDRADRDALSNLRYTLASLRGAIGDRSMVPPFLLITHDTIQFNQASDYWLDVTQLERQIDAARTNQRTDGNDLKSTVALYRGGFLEGFSVGDAAPFEEWALLRREQIAQQVMAALGCLVAKLESRGHYTEAQPHARRQIALEPWNEEAHRALMRVLALDGQRSAALHQFQTCRRILQEDLDVEPAEETVALYEAIRDGRWVDKETSIPGDKKLSARQASSLVCLSTVSPVSPSPSIVARQEQLAQLDTSLAQALAGAGCVVFVTGEAGSGKSALLGEFARRAMQSRAELLVASGVCDAATGIGDPYLPFREILQLLTGDIEPKRAGAGLTPEHARRLWAAIPDAVPALVDYGPDLINTFVPGRSLELRAEAFARQSSRGPWHARLAQLLLPTAASDRSARQTLQLTDIFEQVTHVLQALARRHPLCLVLDDLQWADTGSISLLFHLGRRIATSRILVVAAYRSDAIATPAKSGRHPLDLVGIELRRASGQEPIDLDACEGRPFVEALLDSKSNRLGADFREQLLRHTEGHPLFTVELLRAMEERGDLVRDADGSLTQGPALHWEKLPARVEAAIAERIGRLPERCRMLLAAASVEGEEFTAEVVAHTMNVNEASVVECLSSDLGERHRLVTAVSFQRWGTHRISRYRFRHNLFQRYLYDHLDGVRRAYLHEAVGSALELLHGETPDELHGLAPRLAWHFELAGLADQAAMHYLRAGNRAAKLAAHQEAIDHLTHGLALLDPLSATPGRARLKLDLQLAMVTPLSMTRGFWAPERIDALEQANKLSGQPGLSESPEQRVLLTVQAYFAFLSAQPDRTLEIAREILQEAERSQDQHRVLLAHSLLGTAFTLRAELTKAHDHLHQALAGYERRGLEQPNLALGTTVDVMSLSLQASALWLLGYPDQALHSLERALALAQASNHPDTLSFAQTTSSFLLFLLGRDPEAARRQLEALRLVKGKGLPLQAWASSLASWDSGREKEDESALQQLRQKNETFRAIGTGIGYGAHMLRLAQRCALAGRVNEGLDSLDEAQAWIDHTGVRLLEAEVHRLRGDLLLMDQATDADALHAAETSFRAAIAVARRQEARWWELRATVSLCRLLREQSTVNEARRAEARQILTEIYNWFSEGFEMLDLREARELLEAM